MPTRSVKKVIEHIQNRIDECWASQALVSDDDPEYSALQEQIKAYQDIHVFLTDDEFDGEIVSMSSSQLEPSEEPEEVLATHEETDEDGDEEDETDT